MIRIQLVRYTPLPEQGTVAKMVPAPALAAVVVSSVKAPPLKPVWAPIVLTVLASIPVGATQVVSSNGEVQYCKTIEPTLPVVPIAKL